MVNKHYRNVPKTKLRKKHNRLHKHDTVSKINEQIEQFLLSSGKEATEELVDKVTGIVSSRNEARFYIKEGIYRNIYRYCPQAKYRFQYIHSPGNLDYMMEHFKPDDFLNRQWQYIPYMVKSYDFVKLMSTKKFPLFVKNYNYDSPLYSFSNNYQFDTKARKNKANRSYNDVNFYISERERMLFAKVVNVNYKPINMSLVRQRKRELAEGDKPMIFYDDVAYDRALSISMYSLLEGKADKAMPYFRYDSGNHNHNNLYILDEKRKKVFGDEVQNPHFHFQNEEDSVFCLKKFRDGDRRIKFKTGRCNAIDIPHLRKYLIDLDKTKPQKLEQLYSSNTTYNMPFLKMKFDGKMIQTSIDKVIANFNNSQAQESAEMLENLVSKFKHNQENYTCDKPVFTKLVESLDFLAFIYKEANSCSNDIEGLNKRKTLLDLEIMFANDLIDCMCNNSTKIIENNHRPAYAIHSRYLPNPEDAENDDEDDEENWGRVK